MLTRPRPGRNPIDTDGEIQQLKDLVDADPRRIKAAQAALEAATGKTACLQTLRRALKKARLLLAPLPPFVEKPPRRGRLRQRAGPPKGPAKPRGCRTGGPGLLRRLRLLQRALGALCLAARRHRHRTSGLPVPAAQRPRLPVQGQPGVLPRRARPSRRGHRSLRGLARQRQALRGRPRQRTLAHQPCRSGSGWTTGPRRGSCCITCPPTRPN